MGPMGRAVRARMRTARPMQRGRSPHGAVVARRRGVQSSGPFHSLERIVVKPRDGRYGAAVSVVVALVLVGLSLVLWLGAVFVSFFLFDAPDAGDNPIITAAAMAIWSYPPFALAGIVCGLYFRKRAPQRALLLALAVSFRCRSFRASAAGPVQS